MTKLKFFILFLISSLISCNNDEQIEEITVSTSDLVITMDDIPTANQILGTVDGTTNSGNVTFTITGQTPNEALQINSLTGELTAAYEIDFNSNPIITGIVRVENEMFLKKQILPSI